MLSRVDELEAFKTRISLAAYAASCGYEVNRTASSRGSMVMHHPNGDKVVLAVGNGNHWTYFSVRDDSDHGSIVDFVQRRSGGSLGDVRKILRPFLENSPAPLPSMPTLSPVGKDLAQVRAKLETMSLANCRHPYLEAERRIPEDVLGHPRFHDRIRIDVYGNAVFPHFNVSGISGFEIKNRNFTGFATGGEKGLWASHTEEADTALVIAETAIDALSHFTLRRPSNARYVSTAGSLNSTQPELIRRAAGRLPAGGHVIIATDNDAGGDKLAAELRNMLSDIESPIVIIDDRPEIRGEDWNDMLKRSVVSQNTGCFCPHPVRHSD